MHRKFTGLLLVGAACVPSSGAVDVPSTEVTLEEPLQPSALTALGIEETVAGTYTDGLRTTRSVSAMVAACLRPMLEREPWLKGRMDFQLDVQTRTARGVEVQGGLSSHPAADCVASAFSKGTVGPNAEGRIDWKLEFKGAFAPTALADTHSLIDEAVALDWSAPAATAPREASAELAGTRDRLKRCAFGALPVMEEELWLVMRVGRDGAATLSPDDAYGTDATRCIRRVLQSASFPVSEREYALSLLLTPTSGEGDQVGETSSGREFGMIGLLNSGAGGDPDAPTVAWGRDDSMDPDAVSARGNMWGDAIGDSFGAGGLGLVGTGGGGRGEGIGLGTIGTIGHGAGTGTSQGFGSGGGRLGGAHRSKPPSVRMGATTVVGRLPPEVINRIVRQNFGRFRLCYENGLRTDPKLTGKVTVSFEINRSGEVAKVTHTTDLNDKKVGTCVAGAFKGLSFPQPEGGIVKVIYPISFSPGDEPPAEPAPPPPPKMLGGKGIDALSLADVEARLEERRMVFTSVPGAKDAGVFVRESGSINAVFVAKNEAEGTNAASTCKETTELRGLFVRGPSCGAILRRLLD